MEGDGRGKERGTDPELGSSQQHRGRWQELTARAAHCGQPKSRPRWLHSVSCWCVSLSPKEPHSGAVASRRGFRSLRLHGIFLSRINAQHPGELLHLSGLAESGQTPDSQVSLDTPVTGTRGPPTSIACQKPGFPGRSGPHSGSGGSTPCQQGGSPCPCLHCASLPGFAHLALARSLGGDALRSRWGAAGSPQGWTGGIACPGSPRFWPGTPSKAPKAAHNPKPFVLLV